MKLYNPLITILLAINIASCGDSQHDKENYFSFDDTALKPMYQATDKVDLTLLNTKNKTIDSVAYFVNDKRISSVKGNGKFTLDLSGKKLGYQNVKALVYYEGDTVSTKTRVEVASGVVPKLLKYTIVNTYPHDINAFTEGFEFYNDTLMESTGSGSGGNISYVAKINYKTGKTYKKVVIDQKHFGEGITVLNNKLYELTWQSKVGFIYDASTMKKLKEFNFDKNIEGWGMTNDGKNIYQSDGTEKIWTMNPETQKMIDFINVYTNDSKIKAVNELEWINGKIYGNIWTKDAIAVINPQTGAVEGVLDLTALKAQIKNPKADVLNGIAYNKKTKTIFVTGKNWDKTFEIKVSE
ncbi:glutaminyl-peptide cyclotransferase [Flavobacterium paronense]|uniref:Glutaminyl-peptide cyclotransferase n=1 Tax=Flavobacterium paronense TaxID=1392775 RepID=A0ABV5GB49_9FLAO|nr:glutaminyl-peptide cyclotransferase [Flavobacterium paronense]MDN3676848.1 glutaminyl-peptide cyclotransferase [Flavobacterium paronense]